MDYRTELLNLGKRAEAATGLALATIGFKVAKDGKFFDRLEAGGGCTVDTYLAAKKRLEDMNKGGGHE